MVSFWLSESCDNYVSQRFGVACSFHLQCDWSESRGRRNGGEAGSMSVAWNAGRNMASQKPCTFPLWLDRISPTFLYNRHTPCSSNYFSSKLFRSITLKKELVIFVETSEHISTTRRTNSKAYHNPCSCVFLNFSIIVFVSLHFYSPPLLYRESCNTEQDRIEADFNYIIFTSISMYTWVYTVFIWSMRILWITTNSN